jgi:methionine-rich copper-binding protein CopC
MPAILIKLTAAAALTIAAANPAFAHAHLSQSMPRAGTTVSPPTEIVLTFTERIERAFSNVEVYDSSGKRVEAGKAQVKDTLMRLPL